ncbi:diaminopimelate epimerase [Bacteroides sp. CAG:770]|nr:diaminopimelate epimerase [Bacteroides sp. CAG:770]
MTFYKYHGAGNDFLVADGRSSRIDLTSDGIAALCDRHTGFGADGVMILSESEGHDFRMDYYNSDGSGGMMCGNGGRCIVAFAADLGFRSFDFEAPDGPHSAELLSGEARPFSHEARIVRLKMKDVSSAAAYENRPGGEPDLFLDTGTRHVVRFVDKVNDIDVVGEGRVLRYSPDFAPVGANVNFVQVNADGSITVRTYEKGVEDETLACGTGIVASAMATWFAHKRHEQGKIVSIPVHARISDLSVSFRPSDVACESSAPASFSASAVYLTGPAVFVGKVIADL